MNLRILADSKLPLLRSREPVEVGQHLSQFLAKKADEFAAYGYDFGTIRSRLDRMADTARIVRAMWTEERATYSGKQYRVDQAVCAPKPKQRPHPPIWIGGNKPRVMRVAARLADGFDISRGSQQSGPLTGADIRARIDELRAACETMKRERPLRTSHWSSIELEADRASLQALRERIAAYTKAGLERFILAFPKERAAEMVKRAGELHLN